MTKTCAVCANRIPVPHRRDALTCSPRCRQARSREQRRVHAVLQLEAAPLPAPIPAELATGRRWVRWRTVVRNGRPTKLPLTIDGTVASSTDPATWSPLAAVLDSRIGDGLGVVLLPDDDIVCVDLDHVLLDGVPLPAAARLLARLPRTWVEVSPSGDGLHVWGRARSLRAGRRTVTPSGVSLEAYPHGRYITVTKRRFGDSPLELADLDDVLAALLS